MKTGHGFSHAKIILIGDHAVVYDQPAIALPLPAVNLTVDIQASAQEQRIESRYYNGPLNQADHALNGIMQLILALLEQFDAQDSPFILRIKSQLPAERGMGSSAATAVAVTRAFYDFFQTELPHEKLLAWADFSERIIHGKPSGLDAATASARTPIWFEKGRVPQALTMQMPGYLVIADTGILGQTKAAVSAVAQQLQTQPTIYRPLIEDIGAHTRGVVKALASASPVTVGQHLTAAQNDLKQLGVSSPELDHLCQAALSFGALGAKLTGGGQGGCIIALAATKAQAENLQTHLLKSGAVSTWLQSLAALKEYSQE